MNSTLGGVRHRLANWKHFLFDHPWSIKSFGEGSIVMRPWDIEGGDAIEVGKGCLILQGSRIEAIEEYCGKYYHPKIRIDDGVYIGRSVFMTCIDAIEIGAGCVFSDYVYLSDSSHGFHPENGPILFQALESRGKVVLGKNCFVGYRAVITPGVTLGDWCVVGANAVVTRSFPEYSMLAGAPAKIVKTYRPELGVWVKPEKQPN